MSHVCVLVLCFCLHPVGTLSLFLLREVEQLQRTSNIDACEFTLQFLQRYCVIVMCWSYPTVRVQKYKHIRLYSPALTHWEPQRGGSSYHKLNFPITYRILPLSLRVSMSQLSLVCKKTRQACSQPISHLLSQQCAHLITSTKPRYRTWLTVYSPHLTKLRLQLIRAAFIIIYFPVAAHLFSYSVAETYDCLKSNLTFALPCFFFFFSLHSHHSRMWVAALLPWLESQKRISVQLASPFQEVLHHRLETVFF